MLFRRIFFVLICIGLTLVVIEAGLRLSGKFKTYTEQAGGYYYSYYDKTFPTWYLTYPPDSLIVKKQQEFTNSYRTNSLGLREREFPINKPYLINRYFVLGDSFTEGDGVDYEHSMPKYLEKVLRIESTKYEVYNCGVAGSDPLYNFVLLRDKLVKYHPTHVIMCFNNSDVNDIIFRGGMERFHTDGTTVTRKGPWWRTLYAWSHTWRLIVNKELGYDETFMSANQRDKQTQLAIAEIYKCLQQTKQFCEQNGIKFISVLHPYPEMFNGNGIAYNDIFRMEQRFSSDSISLVNLYPAFSKVLNKDNWTQYGWPINKHFNEKGYELYAKLLFEETMKRDSLFWMLRETEPEENH